MENYCPRCYKHFPETQQQCPVDGTNLVALHESDLTGQDLDGRYRVHEQIGKGGMGTVYHAVQHLIERKVALKVLNRNVVKDENCIRRFLNEARATASLKNAHTITLYDFGVTQNGLLYYTMEFLDGRPLSEVVKNEAPLDFEQAAHIIFQVCESLEEAHQKNILHRDIKPANLFVIEENEALFIKVLDFGIAKVAGDSSLETLTQTGAICGTPAYLSPEQALGMKDQLGPHSDLYSLAIVLYEMLAGSPPFADETPLKVLNRQINEQPPLVQTVNPEVLIPRSLEEFLQRCLRKQPQERFDTVVDFRQALEQALDIHQDKPDTVTLFPLSTGTRGERTFSREDAVKSMGSGPDIIGSTSNQEDLDPAGDTLPGIASTAVALQSVSLSGDDQQHQTVEQQTMVPSSHQTVADEMVADRIFNPIFWTVAVLVILITFSVGFWQPWANDDPGKSSVTPRTVDDIKSVTGLSQSEQNNDRINLKRQVDKAHSSRDSDTVMLEEDALPKKAVAVPSKAELGSKTGHNLRNKKRGKVGKRIPSTTPTQSSPVLHTRKSKALTEMKEIESNRKADKEQKEIKGDGKGQPAPTSIEKPDKKIQVSSPESSAEKYKEVSSEAEKEKPPPKKSGYKRIPLSE